VRRHALALAFALWFSATLAHADTVIQIPNGGGTYRAADQALFFYDANGGYVWLDGGGKFAILSTPGGGQQEFLNYQQSGGGTGVVGAFSGSDSFGSFTATVSETLVTRKVTGGSGRGGGYRTTVTTVVAGTIVYDYASAAIPPLELPAVTWTSDSTSVTLTWAAATTGVPPYTYKVLDTVGIPVYSGPGLSATIDGLRPSGTYLYTFFVFDAAGQLAYDAVRPTTTAAPPPPPPPATLNTTLSCNPDGTVHVAWNADPNAVGYSLFGYDWTPGTWTDLADTTGLAADVSEIGTNGILYLQLYIASYDASGVETDWDQQAVPDCTPPPPPPPPDN
jgi:hypothetical protein